MKSKKRKLRKWQYVETHGSQLKVVYIRMIKGVAIELYRLGWKAIRRSNTQVSKGGGPGFEWNGRWKAASW